MQFQTQPSPKNYSAYFLLFAIGLLVFLTITFTFSFKEKVFQAFFAKPFSFAQEKDETPKADLIVGVDNSFRRGMVSVAANKSNILLRWKSENAKVCWGKFWSNAVKGDTWAGVKDIKGGDYLITGSLPRGIYIYSLNCENEFGDSSGSNITINVGARSNYLQPQIVSFQASAEDGKPFEVGKLNAVSQNATIKIVWSSLNTDTAYGVCMANGSWPTVYQNTGNLQIRESFILEKSKIYKYSIFCSNENGYDSQEISFIAR